MRNFFDSDMQPLFPHVLHHLIKWTDLDKSWNGNTIGNTTIDGISALYTEIQYLCDIEKQKMIYKQKCGFVYVLVPKDILFVAIGG